MPSRRLLDQVRNRLRVKHYSMRTEDTYLQWTRRFICFAAWRPEPGHVGDRVRDHACGRGGDHGRGRHDDGARARHHAGARRTYADPPDDAGRR